MQTKDLNKYVKRVDGGMWLFDEQVWKGIDELLESNRNQTIEECIKALPKKMLPDDGNGDEVNYGWNQCREEAKKKLESLKS